MKAKEWFRQKKITALYYIFRVVPVKKNKIVFCNYVGKGYGCNPKYIAEELMKREEKWDIVWMTKDMNAVFPDGIRKTAWESPKAIYELATAAVWVDNQRKLPYHKKRKKQFFVATWHGGVIPFKKIGADNPNNKYDKPYEQTSHHMDKIVNIMTSNGKLRTEVLRRAFLYNGEVLECGTPRDDILINGCKSMHEKVNQEFRLSNDTKTVLYAPTYRNGRAVTPYNLDFNLLLETLSKAFGGDWVVLLRLHPTMSNKSDLFQYSEKIINASAYPDTQELLAGCDILISDYSAVITEFALTSKPVFLYTSDLDHYFQERDFYFNYFELPFPLAQTNEELEEKIMQFDLEKYKENVKEYFDKIPFKEPGNASAAVVDRIIEWNNKL